MEVKCKATVYFYTDPLEKPEVILEGMWGGRDIVKAGALMTKAYRRHIRDLAREGKLTLEAATKAEDETKEELGEEDLTPPTIEEEKGVSDG